MNDPAQNMPEKSWHINAGDVAVVSTNDGTYLALATGIFHDISVDFISLRIDLTITFPTDCDPGKIVSCWCRPASSFDFSSN